MRACGEGKSRGVRTSFAFAAAMWPMPTSTQLALEFTDSTPLRQSNQAFYRAEEIANLMPGARLIKPG
jgi:hypothetical protein